MGIPIYNEGGIAIGQATLLGREEPIVEHSGMKFLKSGYLVETSEAPLAPITLSGNDFINIFSSQLVDCYDVEYGNGVFIAVGGDGSSNYGGLGVIGRSIDDGVTWAISVPPFANKINGKITAICTDEAGMWLIGNAAGEILRSTDNGLTWSPTINRVRATGSGGSSRILTIVASPANNTYIALYADGKVGRSTDGGMGWFEITNMGITPIDIATDNNGKWIAIRTDGLSVVSVDNGVTWATLSGLSSMRSIDTDRNGVWVGQSATSPTWRRSTDNGVTWGNISVINTNTHGNIKTDRNGNWVGIAEYNDGYGHYFYLVQSSNNGLTWTSRNYGFNSARFSSASNGLGVWVLPALMCGSNYSRSTDDGITWTLQTPNPFIIMNSGNIRHMAGNETKLVVCGSQSNQVIYSNDGGVFWHKAVTLAPSGPINAVAFDGNSTFCCCGVSGRLMRSVDGGANWSNSTHFLTTTTLNGIATNGQGAWGVVGNSNAYGRSGDNGVNFDTVSLGQAGVILQAIAASSSTWIIVGDSGTALRSTDAGLTWKPVDVGLAGSAGTLAHLTKVVTDGFGTWVVVAITDTTFDSAISYDDGLTWNSINQNFVNPTFYSAGKGIWLVSDATTGYPTYISTDGCMTFKRISNTFNGVITMTGINHTWYMASNGNIWKSSKKYCGLHNNSPGLYVRIE